MMEKFKTIFIGWVGRDIGRGKGKERVFRGEGKGREWRRGNRKERVYGGEEGDSSLCSLNSLEGGGGQGRTRGRVRGERG